jgi:hypothetical protein
METSAEWPTVSLATLACASWRSSALSHHVVRGSSGRMKHAATATTNVTTPWIIKSQRHPLWFEVNECLTCAAYIGCLPDTIDVIEFENTKGNKSCK